MVHFCKATLPHAHFDESDDVFIKVFKTIDSTNNEAKRAVANGLTQDGIFVAEQQTAGRGRRGRDFYSPEKSGLYFTAVLHPDVTLADSVGITAATAVEVVNIISEATKKHTTFLISKSSPFFVILNIVSS